MREESLSVWEMTDFLNEMGDKGWHPINIVRDRGEEYYYTIILEREKE